MQITLPSAFVCSPPSSLNLAVWNIWLSALAVRKLHTYCQHIYGNTGSDKTNSCCSTLLYIFLWLERQTHRQVLPGWGRFECLTAPKCKLSSQHLLNARNKWHSFTNQDSEKSDSMDYGSVKGLHWVDKKVASVLLHSSQSTKTFALGQIWHRELTCNTGPVLYDLLYQNAGWH